MAHPVDETKNENPECTCSPGWTGARCSKMVTTTTTTGTTTTTTSVFCNRLGSYCNSGTCVEITGGVRCLCPLEFTGVQCNVAVDSTTTSRSSLFYMKIDFLFLFDLLHFSVVFRPYKSKHTTDIIANSIAR